MTGADLRRLRWSLGMGSTAFGVALGIDKGNGSTVTLARAVRRLEATRGELPEKVSMAASRLDRTWSTRRIGT